MHCLQDNLATSFNALDGAPSGLAESCLQSTDTWQAPLLHNALQLAGQPGNVL
jgi:hypothetical protein